MQQVSWDDAVSFCNWLSRQEGRPPCYRKVGGQWELDADAGAYRLPSEAEWEHACRAGANTEYCFGDGQSVLGSYAVNEASQTLPTGSKLPNAWGVFDMHGNVWEWCRDWYKTTLPGGNDPEQTERA